MGAGATLTRTIHGAAVMIQNVNFCISSLLRRHGQRDTVVGRPASIACAQANVNRERSRHMGRDLLSGALISVAMMLAGTAAAMAAPEAEPHLSEPTTQAKRIRTISRDVYRLLVDVDGAVKGGAAFLVSGRRIVATSNHVIEGGKEFRIGLLDANGKGTFIQLVVVATFPQKDLALLEAVDFDLPGQPLPLASQPPEAPTELYAIGFPAAADPQGGLNGPNFDEEAFYKPSVIKGVVSRVLNNRSHLTQLQHQTPIVPGYSGGPLVSEDGIVVGINTSIHKQASGISFAVLAIDLAEFAAACSVTVQTVSAAGARPNLPRRTVGPAIAPGPDTMNTQSELQSIDTPENKAKLRSAKALLAKGSVSAARLICKRLVETTQAAEAYFCLADTYSPERLKELGAIGIEGDEAAAQENYELGLKARRLPKLAIAPVDEDPRPRAGTCKGSVCSLVNTEDGPLVLCQNK